MLCWAAPRIYSCAAAVCIYAFPTSLRQSSLPPHSSLDASWPWAVTTLALLEHDDRAGTVELTMRACTLACSIEPRPLEIPSPFLSRQTFQHAAMARRVVTSPVRFRATPKSSVRPRLLRDLHPTPMEIRRHREAGLVLCESGVEADRPSGPSRGEWDVAQPRSWILRLRL